MTHRKSKSKKYSHEFLEDTEFYKQVAMGALQNKHLRNELYRIALEFDKYRVQHGSVGDYVK